jgi:hypothetical protein
MDASDSVLLHALRKMELCIGKVLDGRGGVRHGRDNRLQPGAVLR